MTRGGDGCIPEIQKQRARPVAPSFLCWRNRLAFREPAGCACFVAYRLASMVVRMDVERSGVAGWRVGVLGMQGTLATRVLQSIEHSKRGRAGGCKPK